MTAKEYWKQKFKEEPKTDAERLAITMMQEYSQYRRREQNQDERCWVCIIGPVDKEQLPRGFDLVPRRAAIEAIEEAGIEVKNCWSGWGCDEKHFGDIMKVWNQE